MVKRNIGTSWSFLRFSILVVFQFYLRWSTTFLLRWFCKYFKDKYKDNIPTDTLNEGTIWEGINIHTFIVTDINSVFRIKISLVTNLNYYLQKSTGITDFKTESYTNRVLGWWTYWLN